MTGRAHTLIPSLQLSQHTRGAILHTRMATKGSKNDQVNNHPIDVGDIVGVHNGILWNDDDLFWQLECERRGEVDSEAIFAALQWGMEPLTGDGAPRLAHSIEGVLGEIDGDAAVAWLDRRTPDVLHMAKVVGRPLVFAQTTNGSTVFASEKAALVDACRVAGLTIQFIEDDVKDGTYFKVEEGRITECRTFETRDRFSKWGSSSSSGGWTSTYQSIANASLEATKPTPKDDPYDFGVPKRFSIDKDLLNPKSDIRYQEAAYQRMYGLREKKVTEHFDMPVMHFTVYAPEVEDYIRETHARLRPGDWVTTYVADNLVWAQVISMPMSFPGGNYVLRAFLADRYATDGMDVVIVERANWEITEYADRKFDGIPTNTTSMDIANAEKGLATCQ